MAEQTVSHLHCVCLMQDADVHVAKRFKTDSVTESRRQAPEANAEQLARQLLAIVSASQHADDAAGVGPGPAADVLQKLVNAQRAALKRTGDTER